MKYSSTISTFIYIFVLVSRIFHRTRMAETLDIFISISLKWVTPRTNIIHTRNFPFFTYPGYKSWCASFVFIFFFFFPSSIGTLLFSLPRTTYIKDKKYAKKTEISNELDVVQIRFSFLYRVKDYRVGFVSQPFFPDFSNYTYRIQYLIVLSIFYL